MSAKLLLEIGVEGGGSAVFLTEAGKVVEKGVSNSFEVDDLPDTAWEHTYEDFASWWENFVQKNGNFWICFYPLYIDESIAGYIKLFVLNFKHEGNTEKKIPFPISQNKNGWNG